MLEIIANFLSLKIDYDFLKKKKARRKFEHENNLPKKIMINPIWKIFSIFLIFIIVMKILIGYFFFSEYENKKTLKKKAQIEMILENEKNKTGKYPEKLSEIIHNNPLRKNITKDYWNNEFFYEQKEKGNSYILISKGKDALINTEDDIK